jgi:hypothetical protein
MSPVNMSMDMHMLMFIYDISDKLSITVMGYYNFMTMNMKMLPGQMHMPGMNPAITNMSSTMKGIGELKISGIYNLYSSNDRLLNASLGISLPVASINKTEKKNMEMYGEKLVYMMQGGSGTIDFLPAITYLVNHNHYSFGAQASSLIHPYFNSNDYKLGNEFILDSWVAHQWMDKISVSLRLNYHLQGRIQGIDSQIPTIYEPSADPKNYGGNFVNAYTGVEYFFHKGFLANSKIAGEIGLPIYQYFNGIQTSPIYNLNISWILTY